jgi:mannonate dehydratase
MHRRDLLKWSTLGAGAAALPWMALRSFGDDPAGKPPASDAAQEIAERLAQVPAPAAHQAAQANRGLAPLKITSVKSVLTAPAEIRLIVVKVETSEPGLYGLGCATFTQRARVVETAVDKYLRPFLLGKDPTRIEDIWQSSYVSSYWRNGPCLNNAMSGVDMALWDILGKRAGQPLYQLFGGKCREAVDTYRHSSGNTFEEVEASARGHMEKGYRHVRIQASVPGYATYGAKSEKAAPPPGVPANNWAQVFEPRPYARLVPRLFEHCRKKLGEEVELLHDVHERVPPPLALQLCKDLEPYRLYFLEDPFSPEDIGYFNTLRQQTTTPLAMGELFNSPHEWLPLVSGRLIDFLRVHLSQMGGLTPARKMAAVCEMFGVRTAWHGPGDVSPVGHAAHVHLDLATPNFGIQEAREFTQAEQDVFPGCPVLKDGYYWASDRPGLGIDLDEKLAAKFPIEDDPPFDLRWGNVRKKDGTIVKP